MSSLPITSHNILILKIDAADIIDGNCQSQTKIEQLLIEKSKKGKKSIWRSKQMEHWNQSIKV